MSQYGQNTSTDPGAACRVCNNITRWSIRTDDDDIYLCEKHIFPTCAISECNDTATYCADHADHTDDEGDCRACDKTAKWCDEHAKIQQKPNKTGTLELECPTGRYLRNVKKSLTTARWPIAIQADRANAIVAIVGLRGGVRTYLPVESSSAVAIETNGKALAKALGNGGMITIEWTPDALSIGDVVIPARFIGVKPDNPPPPESAWDWFVEPMGYTALATFAAAGLQIGLWQTYVLGTASWGAAWIERDDKERLFPKYQDYLDDEPIKLGGDLIVDPSQATIHDQTVWLRDRQTYTCLKTIRNDPQMAGAKRLIESPANIAQATSVSGNLPSELKRLFKRCDVSSYPGLIGPRYTTLLTPDVRLTAEICE